MRKKSIVIDGKELQEFLMGWYTFCVGNCVNDCWKNKEKCKKAYKQIVALIKKSASKQ